MATPQKTKKFDKEGFRLVASFKKAELDYEIDERLEAGIQLHGSEVKVLRAGKCVISGAHVRVVGGEALLFGMQIPEYPWSHQFNHEPDRPRKLLLPSRPLRLLQRRQLPQARWRQVPLRLARRSRRPWPAPTAAP